MYDISVPHACHRNGITNRLLGLEVLLAININLQIHTLPKLVHLFSKLLLTYERVIPVDEDTANKIVFHGFHGYINYVHTALVQLLRHLSYYPLLVGANYCYETKFSLRHFSCSYFKVKLLRY